jgi:DNA-binding transcriptional ArsR family regulator
MVDSRVGCEEPDRSPEQLAVLRRALVERQRPLQQLAQHYALLGGETRLKILALLRRANELCVCDLAEVLEMTPAAISQHLSRLRAGRLVESRRDGMTIYYRVSALAVDSGALPNLDLSQPEGD